MRACKCVTHMYSCLRRHVRGTCVRVRNLDAIQEQNCEPKQEAQGHAVRVMNIFLPSPPDLARIT